jgi:transposase
MTSTKKGKGKRAPAALVPINRRAAGIDIGSRFHVVAVPGDLDAEPVRSFQSFTGDLNRLADWLVSLGITTVAMESTGIYWVPAYEILEARGLEVVLVNARDAKNVPGRKTDVNDAQWIQQLHTYGLLRASFRPGAAIVALRAYLRHRERMLEYAASHVQHMQKALMQMNLQLHHVVSDITGVTGMSILRAIVGGERDPAVLAAFRDVRCKSSVETIEQALTGNYQPEHVFALRQSLELYDTYQAKIHDCDAEIERSVRALPTDVVASPPPPAITPRQTEKRAYLRGPADAARLARRRPHADQWHRTVLRAAHHRGVRHGHEPMAHGEALHLMAHPRAR